MKFANALKVCLGLGLCFFLSQTNLYAQGQAFVTVVHPIRGSDFWGSKPGSPLSGVKFQKELVEKENLAATWLLRTDVLGNKELVDFFRQPFFEKSAGRQERGIFLEIMPGLAKVAGVSYPQGGVFWHDANKIFLSGYRSEERKRLIDTAFESFQAAFGNYPQSVGAWHIDAFSAGYMRKKYGVTAVLICSDQFGTDGYQIWGGWWGVPFYPSKYNILTPAQTLKNKLDLVVFWWATRDPSFGYGGSFEESTFSVQVNDYVYHGKGIDYFEQLLDTYLKNPANRFQQLTVGIENDYDFGLYGAGYSQQLAAIAKREVAGELKTVTMLGFAEWYQENFQGISPEHRIGQWLMSPFFRVGLVEKDGKTYFRDLRIYNENWPEANLLAANPWGTLSLNNPYKIDTVRFSEKLERVPAKLSFKELIKRFGYQKIPFKQNTFFLLLFYSLTLILLIRLLKKNLPLFFLIISGTVSWSLTMVKSGLVYSFGMGFWGPNGHDGIWHLALINQISRFSLAHPTFAGTNLTNYHFGFDLLAAVLQRLTLIPVVNLYFQILPPLLAILIGILTFKFTEKWTSSRKAAWWATFFVYFGGSWGWLVNFVRQGTFGGESMFWANQAISTLINPPYAFSLVILLLGLIKFWDYLKSPTFKNLIVCSVLLGVLIQIKVYAGIIALGGLAVLAAWSLFFNSNRRAIVKLFLATLAISLLVFLPFNWQSSALLVFSPLWFPRTMSAFGDRLGWFKLENARLTFLNSGQWLKWFLAEGLALTIFVLGNLGTRVLGFWEVGQELKNGRKIKPREVFFLSVAFIALMFPLIFIQKGNPWNTIQFFYYCQFFLGILAGVAVGQWWENQKRWQKLIIAGLLLTLTLPTTISTLKNNYLPSRPPARISIEELEALEFLRRQPAGVVLTPPFNPEWRNKFSEPRPLYVYETTAYVSALSEKPTYLADEMNLEISGYEWRSRRDESGRFFLTSSHEFANNLIKENRIRYLYLVKGQTINLGEGDINASKIFENGEVKIFKVN